MVLGLCTAKEDNRASHLVNLRLNVNTCLHGDENRRRELVHKSICLAVHIYLDWSIGQFFQVLLRLHINVFASVNRLGSIRLRWQFRPLCAALHLRLSFHLELLCLGSLRRKSKRKVQHGLSDSSGCARSYEVVREADLAAVSASAYCWEDLCRVCVATYDALVVHNVVGRWGEQAAHSIMATLRMSSPSCAQKCRARGCQLCLLWMEEGNVRALLQDSLLILIRLSVLPPLSCRYCVRLGSMRVRSGCKEQQRRDGVRQSSRATACNSSR